MPKRFAAVLVLASLLTACSGGGSGDRPTSDRLPRPTAHTDELLLLNWNIRYGTADDGPNSWPARADRVTSVVVGEDLGGTPGEPAWDLVGVQEAMKFQIAQLIAAAPAYGYFGFGRDDGIDAGEHCGLLYRADRFDIAEGGRFWLSDTPDQPGSTSWGNELPRMCVWARLVPAGSNAAAGKGVYVYVTHLDHRSDASRRQAVELIGFRIESREHPGEPVILMGDFNAAPDTPERQYLEGRASDATGDGVAPPSPALIDAAAAMSGPDAQNGTFNGWRAGINYGPEIDAILISPNLELLEAAIDTELGVSADGRPASDHHPIVARVKLPK